MTNNVIKNMWSMSSNVSGSFRIPMENSWFSENGKKIRLEENEKLKPGTMIYDHNRKEIGIVLGTEIVGPSYSTASWSMDSIEKHTIYYQKKQDTVAVQYNKLQPELFNTIEVLEEPECQNQLKTENTEKTKKKTSKKK